tara:strand:- start:528 stop:884 length:357 start_codon:yes stop_codon:yes gene_type:complete
MSLIESVPIKYQNYSNERLPRIGVYYMFSNQNLGVGLCHEFKIDLGNLRTNGDEVITPQIDFAFITERKVLEYLTSHQFQAIRTQIVDGVSFNQLAILVSQIHFQDFLGRHEWIKKMN